MRACALTDYGNLYGAVSFYSTMKTTGIRPIIGYEAFLTFGSRLEKGASVSTGERPYYNLVLLATNLQGYRNLVYLASRAFTDGFLHKPRIDVELLSSRSSGLVGLSGGMDGAVSHFLRRGDAEAAKRNLGILTDVFGPGNFFLEIQDHGNPEEAEVTKGIAELSKRSGIPLVATNDAHYLTADDSRAHDVLCCIGEGRTLDRNSGPLLGSSNYFVRSAEEMWHIFGSELPESLKNTCTIAEMCDLQIPIGDEHLTLPSFPIPESDASLSINGYLRKVLEDGFNERRREVWDAQLESGILKYDLGVYEARLETEIATIEKMGYAGYFLIVWEFIKYARQKDIPVGPGRGSAAGSLAAYCLRITDIDPIQYDLLFERFLNPERVSMPDIDIDFCIRGRADVINHVTEVYGRESVCQIVTFGTMASRAAIKDVGRALNMPYGDVERIAKLIPPPIRGRNVSISQALEKVPELKKAFDSDPQVKELVDLALRLEGCSRHTSVHAAGVVISPTALEELVPVALSSKNELTSQYSMNDLEKVGMLKMDFLALTTLTVIADCLRSLKMRACIEIDWSKIPLDDKQTMELFGDGRTEAIFQFESSGMQEICRRLKPKELEDLSALNALYRPGPLDGGMVEDFISRHKGEKPVRYLIPEMKDILSNTYGVLVYQEQIMQLAQKLAGYSLGEADMMRRAMGKKKREEMAVHEDKFVTGAVAGGIKRDKAEEIFKLMAQFADYGFNRSHSIAYAYLAFQTAYLKAHFPSHFYAAVLSHEADDSAKVYKYSSELRSIGLRLLPPDINESDHGFTPLDDAVRFGLAAIKGIGSASVNAIIAARETGPFSSVFDFIARVPPGAVNRRGLETLVAAGAFDTVMPVDVQLGQWRSTLYNACNEILQYGQRVWEDRTRGQSGLFAVSALGSVPAHISLTDAEPWDQTEMSRQEKAAIGFYLSAHPLDDYARIVEDLKIRNIADHEGFSHGESVTLAGIVSGMQVKYSKKGNRFALFRLEDRSGGVGCLLWGEAFSKSSEAVKDDELLIVSGKIKSVEGQELTLIAEELKLLADALPSSAREINIHLPGYPLDESYLEEILTLLSSDKGNCAVAIDFLADDVRVKIGSLPIGIRGSQRIERELTKRGCRIDWVI